MSWHERSLGGYLLVERIGAGATATVYRARRGAEEVALKVLHPHLARDLAVRARFVREVAVARKLAHPRIVRVYDVISGEDTVALAMELCPGGSLAGWRASGAEEIARVAADVAGALAAAHAQGIVHRDLSPRNLLRDAEGGVKVGDFGSAGVQAMVSLTSSSLLMGSPQYVAPEVFFGHPRDPRTDLYALGAILYEAATGSPPRGAGQRAASPGRGVAEGPLRSVLPAWLAELVLALLAPIERRTESADRVLRALRRGEVAPMAALKRCLFCGTSIPVAAPLCLHCGEAELALSPPAPGEGWFVSLRKVAEEASALERLAELLRALSGQPELEPDLVIGDPRMYSREEQKRKTRLPVRVADDLAKGDAERLALALTRLGAGATPLPMRASRRVKRGPLVQARTGAVVIAEAAGFLERGAVELSRLPEQWTRSLSAKLLFAVYELEARVSAHELRDVMRSSCLTLREQAERLLRELGAARELTRAVDRSALAADGTRPDALAALARFDEAEIEQSRIVARALALAGLVEELCAALDPSGRRDEEAARVALAELDAELGR